jgi:hypothetical protein
LGANLKGAEIQTNFQTFRFAEHIGSSNPSWSASKSIMSQEKIGRAKLCRDFRRLSAEVARVGQ